MSCRSNSDAKPDFDLIWPEYSVILLFFSKTMKKRGRFENLECRNITEYGGMSRNMAEYHGKSRHFPGIYRNITIFSDGSHATVMIFCQLPIDGDEFGLWLKMICIVLDLHNQARFCRYLTNQWNLLHPQSREQVTCLA